MNTQDGWDWPAGWQDERWPRLCPRCGVVHTQKPFDMDKAFKEAGQKLAESIDADILALLRKEL